MTLFTEVFPVPAGAVPKLHAYKLDLLGGNYATIGGKLAYRLRKPCSAQCVWTSGRILSDVELPRPKIDAVLQDLWKEQRETFKALRNVIADPNWAVTPQAQADFVCRGLMPQLESTIKSKLASKRQNIGDAYVDRVYEARGWVVKGAPAVSISVFSRLVYKLGLKEYAARLADPQELVGLFVADKTGGLKGEIIELGGPLRESRTWLLNITQREEMQAIIQKAPDEELVVTVLGPRREGGAPMYNYVASALAIVLRTKDLGRFRIDRQAAQKALRIEPEARTSLVKEVAELVKARRWIGAAFTSTASGHFLTAEDVSFDPRVKFGDGYTAEYDERSLLRNLHSHGLYKRKLGSSESLRVGVIKGIQSAALAPFLEELSRNLRDVNLPVTIIGTESAQAKSRASLEDAIIRLEKNNPHILLGVFDDEIGEDEEDWGSYQDFKSLTVGRGLPSQVVYKSTLSKRFAMGNIVMGVLGKTGNVPYVSAVPLPYADIVVGIDIARKKKENLPGSINATAITRIYLNNGEFLRYVIHDAALEGETIPDNVLQRLFPSDVFRGKRVVVQRDGYYRGDEKPDLKRWAKAIDSEFFLLEVLKTGTPRIYGTAGSVGQPPKGSAFQLSATEAFMVSSLPPFRNATPQPLRLRAEPPFPIAHGIHSVLALTILHYGSLRSPRLPVSIHYSDKIAWLALQGIKPKNMEGDIPFWL